MPAIKGGMRSGAIPFWGPQPPFNVRPALRCSLPTFRCSAGCVAASHCFTAAALSRWVAARCACAIAPCMATLPAAEAFITCSRIEI